MGCAPRGMDGFMEIGYNSRFDPDPEAAPVRPDEVMVRFGPDDAVVLTGGAEEAEPGQGEPAEAAEAEPPQGEPAAEPAQGEPAEAEPAEDKKAS